MKLAEILPEIEKGRRFKRKCYADYIDPADKGENLSLLAVFAADDWELEPLPEEKKMKAMHLEWMAVDDEGRFRTLGMFKELSEPQRRALAYAIRNLLKEFEEEER